VLNGLTAMGYAVKLPVSAVGGQVSGAAADPNVSIEGGTQVIRMRLSADPFYLPSDTYTVKAGLPVRMEISGIGTGCRSSFQIPRLGVRGPLNKPVNIFEFTPKKPGDYVFSCSMGMFPGALKVVSS
jgi:plastocyanin domain-containing protein